MTDRNLEHGNRRDDKAAPQTPSGTPVRPGSARPVPRAAKRADPTEPEVPSAKRVLAIRKQRSLVLVGSAIVALLAVVLFLLYKTGQQVTTLPAVPTAASAALGVSPRTTLEAPPATEAPRTSEPAPASSASATPASSALLPAAPRPKTSSSEIFRKPAF